MRARLRWTLIVALLAACAVPRDVSRPPSTQVDAPRHPIAVAGHRPRTATTGRDEDAPPVRLAFVGDVMLGRGVAPVVAAEPSSVFERLRPAIVAADLAFGNIESPLTLRPHLVGEFALEADPGAAVLLAGAGFDVIGVANNHATDGGPETVLDTLAAVEDAGLLGVGGGRTAADAAEPLVVDVGGISVGVLAFDSTGGSPATADRAGVNPWDVDRARDAVAGLRERADVVVVGLHAGVEYLTRPDPGLAHVSGLLAEWGADVVWGHGTHVRYPVEIHEADERSAVVAPGLGNALFDQRLPGTQTGALLEVLLDASGVVAMRTGRIEIDAGRSSFTAWDEPEGDAVALDGDWWTPVRLRATGSPAQDIAVPGGLLPDTHRVVAAASGDVTAGGDIDLVVAYRRPATPEPAHDRFPHVEWVDADGRSAHVAVYTRSGSLRWGSALLAQPIASIEVCDGALALGFTDLVDDTEVMAGGAWVWDGFGFRTAPVLPGPAGLACADVDGDGRTDPILSRGAD